MAQSLAAPAFAGTAEKKCVVVDYYLTTIAGKINMCPWRSWIARVTPTHKVAGSNPVGHTKKEEDIAYILFFFVEIVKMPVF